MKKDTTTMMKVHERSEARARRKVPPPIQMHHWKFNQEN
jgi:hypothetical protein